MINHKTIIINGVARSGKDTFINYCQTIMTDSYIYNLSTITPVKELLTSLLGDVEKNNKYRKLLSDVKMSLIEYNDYPYTWVINQMQNKIQMDIDRFNIFFIHCREPIEIEKFKTRLVNCDTLLITKPDLDIPNNLADQNVNNYKYNYTINNNGSLTDLRHQASIFCNAVLIFKNNRYWPSISEFNLGN